MADNSQFLPKGPRMMEFVAESEPWAQYKLENGAILRVRPVLVKVIDRDQYDPNNGFPIYQLELQQMLDMTWPDDIVAEAEQRAKANKSTS